MVLDEEKKSRQTGRKSDDFCNFLQMQDEKGKFIHSRLVVKSIHPAVMEHKIITSGPPHRNGSWEFAQKIAEKLQSCKINLI